MINKVRAPGRRSQAEAERTRNRLLDEGERQFARRGYRGVSLRDVAAKAGVQPNTIQHHFGSKERFFQSVLCRWDQQLMDRVAQIEPGGGGVRAIIGELFEFFLDHRDWVAVTAWSALGDGPAGQSVLQDRRWIVVMEKSATGREADLDLGLLLITVEGILNHHVLSKEHYREVFGKDLSDPKLRAKTRDHLERVVDAIVATRGSGRSSRRSKGR